MNISIQRYNMIILLEQHFMQLNMKLTSAVFFVSFIY